MPPRKVDDTEQLPCLDDNGRPSRQYAVYLSYHTRDIPVLPLTHETYAVYIQGPEKGKPLLALRADGELILNDGWQDHALARLFGESIRALQRKSSGLHPV